MGKNLLCTAGCAPYQWQGRLTFGYCQSGLITRLDVFIFQIGAVGALEASVIHLHGAQAHTHTRKTAIVEEVLHGHLPGEIRKECDTIIGALIGRSITKWRHAFGEVH